MTKDEKIHLLKEMGTFHLRAMQSGNRGLEDIMAYLMDVVVHLYDIRTRRGAGGMNVNHFTDHAFRLLLDALMVNDPVPQDGGGDDGVLLALVEAESERRGFDNWVVAFHDFKPAKEEGT